MATLVTLPAAPTLIWSTENPRGEPARVVRHLFPPGRCWGRHRHAFAEVFWVESGGGMHHLDHGEFPLLPGDVWCLRPEHCHAATAGPRGMTIANISFRFSDIETIVSRSLGASWPWRRGPPLQARLSAQRMERLHTWGQDLALSRRSLDRDAFLLDLARLMADGGDGRGGDALPSWLRGALTSLAEPQHLAGGTRRLAQLCERCDDHVNRVIQRCLGRSASELVTELRLDRAASELRLSDHPIDHIARGVGLANLGHFYARFAARFGTTPARYRRAARQVAPRA